MSGSALFRYFSYNIRSVKLIVYDGFENREEAGHGPGSFFLQFFT